MIEENTPVGVPLGKPLEEAAVQAFAAKFRGALVRPGDEAYDAERAVFNAMIDHHPTLIARCTGVADVIVAVNFAREEGLVVAVRGGGHSVPGYAVCRRWRRYRPHAYEGNMSESRRAPLAPKQASRGVTSTAKLRFSVSRPPVVASPTPALQASLSVAAAAG
jgi:hypothetical protein